ncbi:MULTISPECIES: GDP-mannose 4,6-dehydratase [unclassified Lentimonas]|uniref:GDP-mannose 4,6-dehydratase n=1 Tax=unclassified Lentimonas TaxID=2630993 RepID=UPI001323168C|nr:MULTISPECIES: GDP-mannose 4,6-dehydratase [unclassified Lentimonas]CAA6680048.1 dTDP-glucose 4,6-dehydratase (EC [Lentimonas sp. CC4]CAA6685168.1 dTDP-glucose 4,6-dehydratase (EC [Lentimonas sp. CC6]CAA7075106.1 dTDP-glucose 4,6-dehydratase (EC [Lentimonas sp. CC4]CAA7168434.1 dTDP-glucose 4,6-dehydratase (EC [Lentimonas sp. CC21]CAA7182131.1 dTDP-glucose 4,6-dehydratase (EC [Lentimonas sp. CC8]
MKILLTGCAGFIGSHTLDRLLADGHQVIGVDNFDPFYDRALKTANIAAHLDNPNFELLEADLAEPGTDQKLKFLAEGFGQKTEDRGQKTEDGEQKTEEVSGFPLSAFSVSASFDAIIHLAAKAGVRPSIEDPVGYQRANVIATQNLLEFAKENDIKQFVFASSSSVYGVNPNVPWSEKHDVSGPISPYASTKVSCELLGHVYSHLYGIRVLGLRFFTVYGPRQRPDLAINKFARLIEAGEPIPVFGDGSTRRDYTFIADIVEGILGSLHYTGSNYEVINIGNDQTVTLSEMIETIEEVVGKKAIIDRQPEQPGDVPQTWADVSKANKLFGYKPTISFKDGVTKFYDWWRDNQPVL